MSGGQRKLSQSRRSVSSREGRATNRVIHACLIDAKKVLVALCSHGVTRGHSNCGLKKGARWETVVQTER